MLTALTPYCTDSRIHSLHTVQSHSYNPFTLPSTLALSYTQLTNSLLQDCPSLAIRWLYIMLTALTLLFQSVLDIPRMFYLLHLLEGSSIPAALMSEASPVITLLGTVALCYNMLTSPNLFFSNTSYLWHTTFKHNAQMLQL